MNVTLIQLIASQNLRFNSIPMQIRIVLGFNRAQTIHDAIWKKHCKKFWYWFMQAR